MFLVDRTNCAAKTLNLRECTAEIFDQQIITKHVSAAPVSERASNPRAVFKLIDDGGREAPVKFSVPECDPECARIRRVERAHLVRELRCLPFRLSSLGRPIRPDCVPITTQRFLMLVTLESETDAWRLARYAGFFPTAGVAQLDEAN